MKIQKVAVVGAGLMGSGIVSVLLSKNLKVVLVDVIAESLEKAKTVINKNLSKSKEKGFIFEEPDLIILNNLTISSEFTAISDVDLIIEAVSENLEIKKKVFTYFTENAKNDCIIASNTSAYKISDLAVSYKKPERVLGMHFFNPAIIMKLVELIKTDLTEQSVFDTVFEFTKQIGKDPVIVKESFGFIVNRVLIPMINEGICILEEGVSSAEDIDKAMKLGANHPIGPLALADLIGLDTCLAIMETLENGLSGASKYKAAKLLKKYVSEGKLGKKSGEGFYKYS